MSREAAYAVVQRNALRCWQDGTPLLDALLSDRETRVALSAVQISALFTLEPYLAHVDEIFARAGLGQAPHAAPGRRGDEAAARRADAAPAPGDASGALNPEGKRRRGRRGGKAVQAKRARQATPGLPVSRGPGVVQNISERASDYYETAAVSSPSPQPLFQQVDETLGEADHQRDARAKRGAKHQAGAQSRSGGARGTSSRGGSRSGSRGGGRSAAPPATSAPAPAIAEPALAAPVPASVSPPPVAEQPPAKPARPSRSRKPKSEAPADAAVAPATGPGGASASSAAAPPAGGEQHTPDEPAAPKKRSRGTRGGSGRSRKPADEIAPPEE